MSNKEFSGKTALVSGGSRGIGRAIAIKLARHGADIAINFLSREEDALAAKELVEQEGVRCVLVQGDVSEPADVQAMAQKARSELGPIGLLVANAGLSLIESHEQISWESWRKTMAVNLDGAFLQIMAVKDEMLANRYGRIVCISSIASLLPRKMQIHYASSKAGVNALVRCCAQAFAPNVRVNCITPGLIETEMGAMLGPEATENLIAATPAGRLGQAEEIAGLARFLLSDESNFMTGQTITASGGRHMMG